MKKKLLSLVLAGAMVASTSVSAFATTPTTPNTQEVTTNEGKANVEITGNIADSKDDILPGTISVTVPTTANFVVNGDGLSGSTITVTNAGTENVEVYAYQFIDKNGETGINIKRTLQAAEERNNITLYLSGREANAYFTSSSSVTNGIYADATSQSAASGDGIKLATLGNSEAVNLELRGTAGSETMTTDEPIKEDFTLKLKIKKVNK